MGCETHMDPDAPVPTSDTSVLCGWTAFTRQTKTKQHKFRLVINSPKYCTYAFVCQGQGGGRKSLQSKVRKAINFSSQDMAVNMCDC